MLGQLATLLMGFIGLSWDEDDVNEKRERIYPYDGWLVPLEPHSSEAYRLLFARLTCCESIRLATIFSDAGASVEYQRGINISQEVILS